MDRLHTSVMDHEHAYTRSRVPWSIPTEAKSEHERLIHLISGGGMRTFGRTVEQEEISRHRFRFGVVFAVLAAIWLVFWIA